MSLGKKIPTRDGFGDEIVALGKENRNILVEAPLLRGPYNALPSRD